MVNWLRTYSVQLSIGVALLLLPVLVVVFEGLSGHLLDPHIHAIQNGLTYVFLLLFSYVNHTVFIPRWYLTRQYQRYTLIALVCILGIAFLPHRLEQWAFFKPPKENTVRAWIRQIVWAENLFERPSFPARAKPTPPTPPFAPGQSGPPERMAPVADPIKSQPVRPPAGPPLSAKLAIIFLLGSVSTLASVSIQTAHRLQQVENDQLLAELRQLKAQIHPHFLFNTLNSIYALAIRKDDRTADTVVKLAEFMRYMIQDAHRNRVSLQKELDYLRNYIDLQQARLRDSVVISFSLEGDASGRQIAPLLLFTFIENAFKYGVNPDAESVIRIRLTIRDGTLHLHVFNRKVLIEPVADASQVGLNNARERLRLLYPDKHDLRIDNAVSQFTVDLTLRLL